MSSASSKHSFSRLSHRLKVSGSHLSQRASASTLSLISSHTKETLCQRCASLRFNDLRSGKPYTCGTLADIITSAAAGCALCKMLATFEPLGPPQFTIIELHGITRNLSLLEKSYLIETGDIEALQVRDATDRDKTDQFFQELALITHHDDVAATSIKRRPFLKNLESDEAFNLMKQWLDDCVFHHPGCTTPLISKLPTRVLDVGPLGSSRDPFLFTALDGYKESYVALSYCWGVAKNKIVLTKMKAEEARPTFPILSLPKTMQNAVQITRRLGFRYLWIDALCIIQEGDGGEDFSRESAMMHLVYGNAAVTIAAAAAADVDEGIFKSPVETPMPTCRVQYDLDDGTLGNAELKLEEFRHGQSRIEEPLNTRAWTFQERLLSPRVIIFYKDQLGWDCNSTTINSNGPLNANPVFTKDTPGRLVDHIITDLDKDATLAIYVGYWAFLATFYSRRLLSHPGDKLRAISGLAKIIKSKTGLTYLAGVWLFDLRTQLIWHRKARFLVVAKEYRAPSWSWASVDGPILFVEADFHQSRFNILDSYVKLKDEEDEFTNFEKVTLKVEAPMKLYSDDLKIFIHEQGTFMVESVGEFYMDTGKQDVEPEAWALQMTINGSTLIVMPTAQENEFRRVGYLRLNSIVSTSWFKDAKIRVVTLV